MNGRAPDTGRVPDTGRIAAGPDPLPGRRGADRAGRDRRSLGVALLLLAAGAIAALTGAGRAWATVRATSEVPQLGVNWTASAGVTGNDVAPLSAVALLAVVFALGIAVTRGRGRWPVGAVLAAFGLAVSVLAFVGIGELRDTAMRLAISGRLEGLPAGATLEIGTNPIGASLVVAGGLLIATAGVLTTARGRHWPVMGDRYRAPGDRRVPAGDRPAAAGDPDDHVG
jgi:uncharacterized membrane protein (TIGR02234 family)